MSSAGVAIARGAIEVRYPSGKTETVELDREPVSMGRADGNSLVLDDTMASRFHARVEYADDEGWVVVDRGSKNGTFMNGEQVSRTVLADGDMFYIGDTEIRFVAAEPDEELAAGPEAGSIEALLLFCEALSHAEDRLTTLDTCAAGLRAVIACERTALLLLEENSRAPLARFGDASEELLEEAPQLDEVRAQRNPASLVVPLRDAVLIFERAQEFSADEVRFARLAGAHLATFLRFVT